MKKYTIEFIGTCLFVLCIIGVVHGASALIPLYIGIALAALIYMGGAISGAHYNPAVTLGLFMTKNISLRDGIAYIIAQLAGAIVGYVLATKGLGMTLPALWALANTTTLIIAEGIFTFALISTVLFTAVHKSTAGNSYFGFAIGAVVIIGAATVGTISGGFFNPAVLLGIGLFGIPLKSVWAILVWQLLGALWAAWIYRFVTSK